MIKSASSHAREDQDSSAESAARARPRSSASRRESSTSARRLARPRPSSRLLRLLRRASRRGRGATGRLRARSSIARCAPPYTLAPSIIFLPRSPRGANHVRDFHPKTLLRLRRRRRDAVPCSARSASSARAARPSSCSVARSVPSWAASPRPPPPKTHRLLRDLVKASDGVFAIDRRFRARAPAASTPPLECDASPRDRGARPLAGDPAASARDAPTRPCERRSAASLAPRPPPLFPRRIATPKRARCGARSRGAPGSSTNRRPSPPPPGRAATPPDARSRHRTDEQEASVCPRARQTVRARTCGSARAAARACRTPADALAPPRGGADNAASTRSSARVRARARHLLHHRSRLRAVFP